MLQALGERRILTLRSHAVVSFEAAFRAGPVVARNIENGRVLVVSLRFDGVEQAPDLVVRLLKESCVHLHLPRDQSLLVGGH
jgi:hypothetical protein